MLRRYVFLFVLLSVVTCMGLLAASRCSQRADVELVATMFTKCSPAYDFSNCPSDQWLVKLRDLDARSKGKKSYTFVNVGFNKGYNFAMWFSAFAPSWGVNASTWHDTLSALPDVYKPGMCGVCKDCEAPPFAPGDAPHDPTIHVVGVDLNKHNIDIVNRTINILQAKNRIRSEQLHVSLIHAAGGNGDGGTTPTILKIPKCQAGYELCSIPVNASELTNASLFDLVPILPIDKLVRDLHLLRPISSSSSSSSSGSGGTAESHNSASHPDTSIRASTSTSTKHSSTTDSARQESEHASRLPLPMIDILHIDTEGNDAEVLKSAPKVLHHRRVRILIFEYHYFGLWNNTRLHDVVNNLGKHNLECYFMGQTHLWPISHSCWHDYYEFHYWSNVMCVLRSDPWYAALQPLVQTADALRGQFKEGDLIKGHRQAQVYVVRNGTRYGFNSLSAFTSRGYSVDNIKAVRYCDVAYVLPQGEDLL